ATCQAMTPSANPVYMITSLAVSPAGTTRRMVQAGGALSPAQPFPSGFLATATVCPALTISGGGNTDPATDSYTSASGGTYSTTQTDTLGDVGANGGVSLNGHSQVGGAVAVPSTLATPPATPNPCSGAQGDYSTVGTAGIYQPETFPGNVLQQAGPFVFPAPADPIPLPTPGSPTGGSSLVPGTYGAISLSGHSTLTLAPGVYNIY